MNEQSPGKGVRTATVPDDRAGQRLDNFLLGQLKGAPRSLIYKLVRSGQVRINGKRAKPDSRLEGGDLVRVPPVILNASEPTSAAPVSMLARLEAAIVFEDERLLALDKPSGVASHGRRLASHSEKEILNLHGMGPSSIPKLKAVLKQAGLSFKK